MQKLNAIRNGYSYWSDVIDQTHGTIPDLVGAPMMSGYAPMGGFWDYLTGGPKTEVMTASEAALSRMNAYIAQVGDRLTRLKDGGANAYYPTDIQLLTNGISDMRQIATYGDPNDETREGQVRDIYEQAVILANRVARDMDDMGKGVYLPASLQTMTAKSWWDTTLETIANAFTVGSEGKGPESYPDQAAMVKRPVPTATQSYTPSKPGVPKKTPGMPSESLIAPDGSVISPTEDWLRKNGLWLGLGAAALVGAYLYFRKQNEQRAMPVSANPRRGCRKRSRNPHVPFNVYLKGKLIDTVFYSDPKTTTDYVKRGLINHDGYDPGIRVVKRRRKRGK
jgi:hypothetical protein